MRFFVKAIASGFAMSLGSAIFKKVSKKIGLHDEKTEEEKAEEEKAQAAESDTEGEADDATSSRLAEEGDDAAIGDDGSDNADSAKPHDSDSP